VLCHQLGIPLGARLTLGQVLPNASLLGFVQLTGVVAVQIGIGQALGHVIGSALDL
jgi:hypothetical protein